MTLPFTCNFSSSTLLKKLLELPLEDGIIIGLLELSKKWLDFKYLGAGSVCTGVLQSWDWCDKNLNFELVAYL